MKTERPPIESGHPLPRGKRSYGSWADVPFKKIRPGQSMFFKDKTSGAVLNAIAARRRLGQLGMKFKFTVRKIDGGARLWRTK